MRLYQYSACEESLHYNLTFLTAIYNGKLTLTKLGVIEIWKNFTRKFFKKDFIYFCVIYSERPQSMPQVPQKIQYIISNLNLF